MNTWLTRLGCLLSTAVLVGGCYTSRTSRLETPIERELKVPTSFSILPPGERIASIGDVLFELRRYKTGAVEHIAVRPPPKLQPFPTSPEWKGTHAFSGDDGAKFTVYTHREYYEGTVGVILDQDDKLATPAPLVQVSGVKEGRRWKLGGAHDFFYVPADLIESWGLRYGGRRGTEYVFEIIDRANPTVTQIVQSIQVSEAEFRAGFSVKGVLVHGLADEGSGIIKYTLTDLREGN